MKFQPKICNGFSDSWILILLPIFIFFFTTGSAMAVRNIPSAHTARGTALGGTIPDTEADLSIFQTESADPVQAGDNLRYTLFIANSGPGSAQDVVVMDSLPAHVTLIKTTGCNEDPVGVPTCSLGTLAAGASTQVTIDVAVDANASGTIANQATFSTNTPDPENDNNVSTEETTIKAIILPESRVEVRNRVHGESRILLGHTVTFTVQIINTGDVLIPNLPLAYSYQSAILQYESATIPPDDLLEPIPGNASDQPDDRALLRWKDLRSQGFEPGETVEILLRFRTVAETTQLPNGQTTTTAQSLNGAGEDAAIRIFESATITLTARTVQVVNGVATIQWATVSEKTVQGYHIWRQIGTGERIRITQALIPANLSGQTGGASYRKEFPFSPADQPTTYTLEIVLLSGAIEFHELGTIAKVADSNPPSKTPTPIPSGTTEQGVFLPLIRK